nr:hypothetical protein [Roseibium sp.]
MSWTGMCACATSGALININQRFRFSTQGEFEANGARFTDVLARAAHDALPRETGFLNFRFPGPCDVARGVYGIRWACFGTGTAKGART